MGHIVACSEFSWFYSVHWGEFWDGI
jgi:hypothetical protein